MERQPRRKIKDLATLVVLIGGLAGAGIVAGCTRESQGSIPYITPDPSQRAQEEEDRRRGGGWVVINNLLNP